MSSVLITAPSTFSDTPGPHGIPAERFALSRPAARSRPQPSPKPWQQQLVPAIDTVSLRASRYVWDALHVICRWSPPTSLSPLGGRGASQDAS